MSVQIYSILKQEAAENAGISLNSSDFRKSFFTCLTPAIGNYVAERAKPTDGVKVWTALAKKKERHLVGTRQLEKARKEQKAKFAKTDKPAKPKDKSDAKNQDKSGTNSDFNSLGQKAKNKWLSNKKRGAPTDKHHWCKFHRKWVVHPKGHCWLDPDSPTYKGDKNSQSTGGKDGTVQVSFANTRRGRASRSPSERRGRSRNRSPTRETRGQREDSRSGSKN
jgi:hypothetical protein